jgi:uncharacterized protein (TIGR02996 family)
VHNEDEFLKKILEDPADDTPRLVYADWLDEQGDPLSSANSQFLRLTARMRLPKRPNGDRAKLQKLAAKLDTDWLGVVSRLKLEGCGAKRDASDILDGYRRLFAFLCDQKWDEMTPTDDDAVRRCEKCLAKVHYCDTLVTARQHAGRGHCVALDLGIIRRPGDLFPTRVMIRGKITVEGARRLREQERERNRIDDVSAERERRKREQAEGNG